MSGSISQSTLPLSPAQLAARLGYGTISQKDDQFFVTGSADTTKKVRLEVDTNVSTGTTRVLQPLDRDGEIQDTPIERSENFTAEKHGIYVLTASLEVTDPLVPAQGHAFECWVRNGTAVIGGVSYAAPCWVRRIFHSGSWSSFVGKEDSALVHTTGTESIGGTKDFTGTIKASGITQTGSTYNLVRLQGDGTMIAFGTELAFLPLSGGTMTGPIAASAGTVSLPSLTFSGDTDTGLYSYAANSIGFAAAGGLAQTVGANTTTRYAWNTVPYYIFHRSNAAAGSQGAVVNGNPLGTISCRPSDGVDQNGETATIYFVATEDHAPGTNSGTSIVFQTTPTGTGTIATAMTLADNQIRSGQYTNGTFAKPSYSFAGATSYGHLVATQYGLTGVWTSINQPCTHVGTNSINRFGYGSTYPRYYNIQIEGSYGAETAAISGRIIGRLGFLAYDGATAIGSTNPCAFAQALTTEAHTATAHGAKLEFYTTANGATSSTLRTTIGQDGVLAHALTTDATSTTAASATFAGGVGIAKTVHLTASSAGAIQWGATASGATRAYGNGSGAIIFEKYDGAAWVEIGRFG